jgi:hypothetical protein
MASAMQQTTDQTRPARPVGRPTTAAQLRKAEAGQRPFATPPPGYDYVEAVPTGFDMAAVRRQAQDEPDDLIALAWEARDFVIHDLRVPAYQRPVQHGLVKRIVNDYQPRLMQPLIVNLRLATREVAELTGPYVPYVIDGQQRKTALEQLGWENRTIQCIAYTGLSEEQEAYIYTESQKIGNRRNMTPMDHLRGAAAYGNREAQDFIAAVEGSGISLDEHQPTHATNLRAIATGLAVARHGSYHLERVLRILIAGFPIGKDENPLRHVNRGRLNANMLTGTSILLRRFERLDEDRLTNKLREVGLANVAQKAIDYRRVVMSARWGGATARALLFYYNEGLRSNRLHWGEGEDERPDSDGGE